MTAARRSKKDDKNAANPDSVKDQTNIGERNTAEAEGMETQPIQEEPMEQPSAPKPMFDPEPEIELKGEVFENPQPNPDGNVITVTAQGPENKIVVAEVSPRHPNGQLVLQGGESGQAARTARVMELVSLGSLVIEE